MCELKKEDFKTFLDANNNEYIIWYEDDDYRIAFSDIPDTRELKINKIIMTKEQIEDIKKKIRSNCNFSISIQVMALNIYEVIK